MNLIKTSAIVAFISGIPTALAAQSLHPADFDKSENHLLEPQELAQYRSSIKGSRDVDTLTWESKLRELEEKYGVGSPIPVIELGDLPKKEAACNTRKPYFILRKSILDATIVDCNDARKIQGGASLSFEKDNEAGVRTFSIDGALGYVFSIDGSEGFTRKYGDDATDAYFSDANLLLFVEGKGTLNDPGDDDGYLLAGAKYQANFGGGLFDWFGVGIAPYYQTDLSFDGRGYGLALSFTPTDTRFNLNAINVGETLEPYFYFEGSLIGDFLHITDASGTAFAGQSDKAWIGIDAGITYAIPVTDKKKVELSLEGELFWDVINNQEALLGVAQLSLPIADDGFASVDVTYTRGKKRQNLKQIDEFSVKYSLKF